MKKTESRGLNYACYFMNSDVSHAFPVAKNMHLFRWICFSAAQQVLARAFGHAVHGCVARRQVFASSPNLCFTLRCVLKQLALNDTRDL